MSQLEHHNLKQYIEGLLWGYLFYSSTVLESRHKAAAEASMRTKEQRPWKYRPSTQTWLINSAVKCLQPGVGTVVFRVTTRLQQNQLVALSCTSEPHATTTWLSTVCIVPLQALGLWSKVLLTAFGWFGCMLLRAGCCI